MPGRVRNGGWGGELARAAAGLAKGEGKSDRPRYPLAPRASACWPGRNRSKGVRCQKKIFLPFPTSHPVDDCLYYLSSSTSGSSKPLSPQSFLRQVIPLKQSQCPSRSRPFWACRYVNPVLLFFHGSPKSLATTTLEPDCPSSPMLRRISCSSNWPFVGDWLKIDAGKKGLREKRHFSLRAPFVQTRSHRSIGGRREASSLPSPLPTRSSLSCTTC